MNPRGTAVFVVVGALWARPIAAQDVSAEASVGTEWTDNVHLMRAVTAGSSIGPSLRAGLDIGMRY